MPKGAVPRWFGGPLVGASLAIFGAKGASAAPRVDAEFLGLFAPSPAGRHPFADRSGRIPLVVEVPPFADARALGFQPLGPGLATVRVAPAAIAAFEAAHPDLPFSVWPPLRPVLDASARLNGTLAYRAALRATSSPLEGTGRGVVVGIVDTGLDLAHPDFRDEAGGTRVAWMLDFSRGAAGLHPDLEVLFGCTDPAQTACAVLEKADIDRALSGASGVPLPRDRHGHGTHVTSIAAGNGGPDGRFVGGAPGATLIIANASQGTGGAATDVDVVTGVRFVFDRAEAMGLPAAVNLSVGSDFGPHDGTTPLEKALASLVGPEHPGRALVVAAGNSASLFQGDRPEQALGVHTQARVTRGVPAEIPILSPGVTSDADLSGAVYAWITYRAGDEVAIGLRGPKGAAVAPVRSGAKGSFATPDRKLTAAIYNGVVDPSPLTSDMHGAIVAWEGEWPSASQWVLTLEGEGFVEAWEQSRIDTGPAAGQDAYFELATRQGTINVPATHPDLIAVGCTVNRTAWIDADGGDHDNTGAGGGFGLLSPVDSTCYFSSQGPTAAGIMKPDLSAPGAMVAAAMSGDAVPSATQPSIFSAPSGLCAAHGECLVVDDMHALLSGSSMSSPQVAGAAALLFERDPGLTQGEILRLLQQGVRRPTGKVGADYQLGAGALDVVGAAAAYSARAQPITREPDAAASWMVLSDAYLKPNGKRAVLGSVSMRAADGALADGFGDARLTLQVAGGGMVVKPLARVAAGLYRFEIAGREDAGGEAAQIDVRLDGVAIGIAGSRLEGHRAVPVGADRWIALGAARAYGGCSLARVGANGGAQVARGTDAPRGGEGPAGVALVLALLSFWRRRAAQGAAATVKM